MSTRKAALQSLWKGSCNVYALEYSINAKNGRSEAVEALKLENEPCRLSFESVQSAGTSNSAATIRQTTKLFIDSSLSIPAGGKIVVTQNGVTNAYSQSGESAVHKYHQEIMLEPFEDYA